MEPRTRNLALLAGLLVLVPAGVWLLRSPTRSARSGGVRLSTGTESAPPIAEPQAAGDGVRAAVPAGRSDTVSPFSPLPLHDEPAPAAEMRVLRIEGRVVDLEARPIDGAELFVSQSGNNEGALLARSGADGAFVAELPVTGSDLYFIVQAERFQGQDLGVSRPGSGVLQLGTFRLAPGGEVVGRVLDESGQPIRGAIVSACPPSAYPEDEAHARESGVEFDPEDQESFQPFATSGSDGRYRLRGVAPGEWFLFAWREGRSCGWTQVLEVQRDVVQERDIVLPPSSRAATQIAGTVRDPQGRPLRSIRVEAGLDGLDRAGLDQLGQRRSDLTDADGRFLLNGDWTQPVLVRGVDREERWASAERPGVVPGTLDLELVLGEPMWLTVRLEDERGDSIPWGHVRHAETGRMHDTGRDGFVRLPEPSKSFRLEGSAPGYRTELFGPFEPEAAEDELVLTLRPGQALRGRVLFQGRPVAGAKVDLCGTREPGTTVEARGTAPSDHPFLLTGNVDLDGCDGTSDRSGSFLLTLHQDGWQSLRVEAEGFPMQVFGPFQVSIEAGLSGVEVELERAGAIEGRVLLRPGEDPAQRLVGACNGWSFVRVVPVTADGTYRIDDLAPGAYQLRACRPPVAALQELDATLPVDEPIAWDCRVAAGETTRFDLDLAHEGSVVLAGEFALEDARPQEWQARLLAGGREPDWWSTPRARAEVDAGGRFELVVSRAGRYRLQLASAAVFVDQELDLVPGRNEWSYRHPAGRLRVRASESSAERGELLRFRAEGEGPARFTSLLHAYLLRSNDAVDWSIDAPAGPGRLERALDGYSPDAEWTLVRELTVVAGQELVLDYP